MFEPSMCENCKREIVRTYPETDLCEQCEVMQINSRLQFLPFSTCLGQAAGQLDVTIGDLLVPFLCFDYQRGARKRFLYCALLSRQSSFKKFTYFRNGMHGSISQHEDILDRILSFV